MAKISSFPLTSLHHDHQIFYIYNDDKNTAAQRTCKRNFK